MQAVKRPPILLILLFLLIGSDSLGGLAQSSDAVSSTFWAAPSTAVVDETEIQVILTLTGDISGCSVAPNEVAVDAVLVMDISSSMTDDEDRLTPAQDAARLFIQTLNLELRPEAGGDQVGLVVFSSGATQLEPLTQDVNALAQQIDQLTTHGSTEISSGIDAGTETLLDPSRQNTNAARVMVLLTDGIDQDTTAVDRAADYAKAAGIRIVTVKIGEANTEQLQEIASSPSDFIEVTDVRELPAFFLAIAEFIQPTTAARDLTITYQFDGTLFDLVPSSSEPPAVESGNTLTWTRSRLNNDTDATFSFRLIARQIVNGQPIGQLINSSYTVCDTTDIRPINGIGPTLIALQATPLPLPTATPIPPPTQTPPPTLTSTPPGIVRQDQPINAPTEVLPALTQILGFCNEGIWSLLPLLIAIVLFILWLVWAIVRYRHHHASDWKKRSVACWLAWSVVRAYAFILLWLFLLPLFGSICEGRESVYFWRQDPLTAQTGIFLTTATEQENTYSSFNAINERGCVGCHAISSSSRRVAVAQGILPFSLAVYDFDGSLIPVPSIQVYYMAWSPDGQRLAMGGTSGDIQILDIQSGAITTLQGADDPTAFETMPSWGSNGEIAFVRGEDPAYSGLFFQSPTDIYVVPETGGTARPVAGASGGGFNYYPAFSPDSQWISFTYHDNQTTYSDQEAEIYIVPSSGGTPVRLQANNDATGNPSGGANSWASWSRFGDVIAFNSQRMDSSYDLFTAPFDPTTGDTGNAVPLVGASEAGVFEHLPYWGLPASVINPVDLWLSYLPWLLLLPLLMLGAMFVCRLKTKPTEVLPPDPPKPTKLPPPGAPEPLTEPRLHTLWEPRPTLIIGLGESGRWTLTHIKKSLMDAGVGTIPSMVRLLLLDTGDYKTVRGANQPVTFGGVELVSSEVIELRSNLSDFLKDPSLRSDPQFREWLPLDENDERWNLFGKSSNALDLNEGANGRRVIARLGLLQHLRKANNNFFTRLLDAAGDALEFEASDDGTTHRRLHVVIVGDTFGDVGSAALFDTALLVREAGTQAGAENTIIAAHVVTDYARKIVTRDEQTDRTNTGATIREIERFQLAASRQFRIYYDQIKQRTCETTPIDTLYIYDGSNMPNVAPQFGLYPMIADAVTLWMDSAARQGSLRQLQSQQYNLTLTEQARTDQVHVFTQGLFTYRLPFADLLDAIRYRFEQEVFRRLVMGRSDDANLRLDAALNTEQRDYLRDTDGSPARLAQAFLMGRVQAHELPLPKQTVLALTALSVQSERGYLNAALRAIEPTSTNFFVTGLREMLRLILNGTQSNVEHDIYKARGGKLGYAIEFVENVIVQVDHHRESLQAANGAAPLIAVLDAIKATAEALNASLDEQAKILGLRDGIKGNLKTLVLSRYADLNARRREMDQISSVRQYIWEDADGKALEDIWYNRHIIASKDLREEALKQLYWQVNSGDQVMLVLQIEDTTNTLTGSEFVELPIAEWEKAFFDMASRYASVVQRWELPDGLFRSTILSEDTLGKTLTPLRELSIPLAIEESAAGSSQKTFVLARSDELKAVELENEIDLAAPVGNPPLRLDATDSYSIVLNSHQAIIPLNAISTLNEARKEYLSSQGIGNTLLKTRPMRMLTAVFEAEAAAIKIERNLAAVRERADLLHPVVVAALTESRRAKAFLLAIAADDLDTRRIKGERLVETIYTGVEGRISLGTASEQIPPLLIGLYSFINNTSTVPDQTISTLLDRYQTDEELVAVFANWSRTGWQSWADEVAKYEDRYRGIVQSILSAARVYAHDYGLSPQ